MKKVKKDGNILQVQCKTDTSVRKVEVYIDGKLVRNPVTSSYDNIIIKLDNSDIKGKEMSVIGYDYFLNCTIDNRKL